MLIAKKSKDIEFIFRNDANRSQILIPRNGRVMPYFKTSKLIFFNNKKTVYFPPKHRKSIFTVKNILKNKKTG